MKKTILCFALLGLLPVDASADVILGTSNPAGSPLAMNAGTTSGPMYVTVVDPGNDNDVMFSWQFVLQISPISANGPPLTFEDPATSTPPDPPNYIFGNGSSATGFGIAASNTGNSLTANDFDLSGGTPVPGSQSGGANLLQMDFLASATTSGLFGIYAVPGTANTVWSAPSASEPITEFFSNVASSGSPVLIGEVEVQGLATPEPSALVSLLLCVSGLGARYMWQRRRLATVR